MSKTICQASVATIASTANTDEYWKICGVVAKTTDANAQIKFNSAGILSGLYVVVTANSVAALASTGTLRKNGTTDLSNVAIFTASTPGSYEDTSNTDTISATDSVCMKTHPGAASGTYSIICNICNI